MSENTHVGLTVTCINPYQVKGPFPTTIPVGAICRIQNVSWGNVLVSWGEDMFFYIESSDMGIYFESEENTAMVQAWLEVAKLIYDAITRDPIGHPSPLSRIYAIMLESLRHMANADDST